jgi:hypothetical protein
MIQPVDEAIYEQDKIHYGPASFLSKWLAGIRGLWRCRALVKLGLLQGLRRGEKAHASSSHARKNRVKKTSREAFPLRMVEEELRPAETPAEYFS